MECVEEQMNSHVLTKVRPTKLDQQNQESALSGDRPVKEASLDVEVSLLTKGLQLRAPIKMVDHGGRDDSILSAKLIRIAPETSSFYDGCYGENAYFFEKLSAILNFYDYLRSFPTGYPVISRTKLQKIQNRAIAIKQKRA
jgi:hypothetical protein